MKRTICWLFLLVFSISFSSAEKVEFIEFERGILERAKVKAAEEGKLLFIDFYAKWCTPCKWMDETTFSDPNVIKQLDNNYVAIKVDIDDMEGFELKSRFDVRYLPTMLIFNTDGKLVERIEETLSPSKMHNILGNYIVDEVGSIPEHAFNTSPLDIVTEKNTAKVEEPKEEIVDSSIDQGSEKEQIKEEEPDFKLQMGVFRNRQGAETRLKTLESKFVEPLEILEVDHSEVPMFKVVMGDFESIESAKEFKSILYKEFELDSIVLIL